MEILSATTVFDSHVGQTKMKKVTIDQIITDENATIFDPTSSDHITYPEFVAYFAGISHITRHHLIIGANFTYGWMPTMFEFKTHDLEDAVLILNMAKKRQLITIAEMKALSNVLNNSMVGT